MELYPEFENSAGTFQADFEEVHVASQETPNALKYVPQNLTPEQQAQARQNINAMQNGLANTDLDMQRHTIENASGIVVTKKLDVENEDVYTAFKMSCGSEPDGKSFTLLSDIDGRPVRISGVLGGVTDNDAATFGQVKEMLEQTGGGSVVIVEPIGNLKVNMTSKQIYDCILNGDTVYLELQETYYHLLAFCEQEVIFSAWVDEFHSAWVVDENANITAYEYDYTKAFEQLSNKVDNILPDASDEAYPTALAVVKYVNNCVGDIETALDNIISIQESLIGGAAE